MISADPPGAVGDYVDPLEALKAWGSTRSGARPVVADHEHVARASPFGTMADGASATTPTISSSTADQPLSLIARLDEPVDGEPLRVLSMFS